jgi:hypothetical protein
MTWTDAITTLIFNSAVAWIAFRANARAERAEKKADLLLGMMEGQSRMNDLQKIHLNRIEEFLHEIRKILQHNKT